MQNRLNKENVNSFSIFCLFILLREPIFNSLVSNFLCLLCLCRNMYAKKISKFFQKWDYILCIAHAPKIKGCANFLFLEMLANHI